MVLARVIFSMASIIAIPRVNLAGLNTLTKNGSQLAQAGQIDPRLDL